MFPTPDNLNTFNEFFCRKSYDSVKDDVLAEIKKAGYLKELYSNLDGYDLEFDEDYETENSFYCERELDRSHVSSEADYISVEFLIAYNNKTKEASIDMAELYVAFPEDGVSTRLCSFDPNTCEVYEWFDY